MSEPKFSSPQERDAYRYAKRVKYLCYLREGYNSVQAAIKVGVNKRTARVWRNGRGRCGGRKERPRLPLLPSAPPFYNKGMEEAKKYSDKFLTLCERIEIYRLLTLGLSQRQIGLKLGRHHSAVNLEIKKNLDSSGSYCPVTAHGNFLKRLSRPKELKISRSPDLWICILSLLELRWSPMQISKHLLEAYPCDPAMQLSHEAIYRAIYIQGKGGLRTKLKNLMRQGRACRKPRKGKETAKSRFREPMVNISQRPAEANDRAVPGHWEGDLIMGRNNKTAIGTLVERSTRYCILLHLPKDHTADSVQKEVIRKMKRLPEHLKRSLAWDQGAELALHGRISRELDMQVFFCDPHSPWQRGTNENTNGLLRQYFPKGTCLSVHSDEELDRVAAELNGRPRMTLGWKSPAQKFLELQNRFA